VLLGGEDERRLSAVKWSVYGGAAGPVPAATCSSLRALPAFSVIVERRSGIPDGHFRGVAQRWASWLWPIQGLDYAPGDASWLFSRKGARRTQGSRYGYSQRDGRWMIFGAKSMPIYERQRGKIDYGTVFCERSCESIKRYVAGLLCAFRSDRLWIISGEP
jgi:hypothetical protein